MRAGEAYAPDAFDPPDGAEQFGEERSAPGDVAPVRIDVLPNRVTSVTPRRASSPTSATISSMGRLTSGPRTAGTMQNAQELSQPVWMLTQAAYGSSRIAAGPRSGFGVDSGRRRVQHLHQRALVAGPAQKTGALVRLCVPNTTSTQPTFSWMRARSFWARHPPTAICNPGFASTSSLRRPSVP